MKLADYMREQRHDDETFGAVIGAPARAVKNWRLGYRIPRLSQIQKISAVTSGAVLPNDFYQAATNGGGDGTAQG